MSEQLDALDSQIAALQAERQERAALEAAPWPKRTTLYVHRSKEDNYHKGEALGLSEGALETFLYTFYEIGIEVDVSQAGEVTILAIEGKPVQREGA